MLSTKSESTGNDQRVPEGTTVRVSPPDTFGGGVVHDPTPEEYVDIRACLIELENICGSNWGVGSFAIAVRLQPCLPEAKCDRQELQGALLNLIFNARDAMPDGGVISIEAVAIERASGPTIELRIEDQGVGMTPETMHLAFEPFFTTKGKGLGGVGLPMVRHFVESHGGSITLHSIPRSGTTAIVSLPARPYPMVEIEGRQP